MPIRNGTSVSEKKNSLVDSSIDLLPYSSSVALAAICRKAKIFIVHVGSVVRNWVGFEKTDLGCWYELNIGLGNNHRLFKARPDSVANSEARTI